MQKFFLMFGVTDLFNAAEGKEHNGTRLPDARHFIDSTPHTRFAVVVQTIEAATWLDAREQVDPLGLGVAA